MPAPVVGAERGGASPGGEPAAHLEDAGGRGAGRHQPRSAAGEAGWGSGQRRRRRISGATRRALGGKEELSGRMSERDEKNLREMSEREVQKN